MLSLEGFDSFNAFLACILVEIGAGLVHLVHKSISNTPKTLINQLFISRYSSSWGTAARRGCWRNR